MMSPTEYVCLGLPPRASARGSGPAFSRPNRSLMRSVNGRSDTKSRAVAFRATVAVSVLVRVRIRIRIRIFVLVAVVADVFALAAMELVPSPARQLRREQLETPVSYAATSAVNPPELS